MAKPGALSTKREQLEALAVISIRFDADTEAKIINGEGQEAMLLMEAVDIWMKEMLLRIIQKCCYMLCEWDGWSNLVTDPKRFNEELDLYLNGAKTAMRILYGIPDNRPLAPDNNPLRVAALKKEFPDASWGQLSMKFQLKYGDALSPNAAERAYQRFIERVQQLLKRMHKLAEEFRTQSGLPEDQLADRLPTPERVLDILTDKIV
jgi:hypothetical protein